MAYIGFKKLAKKIGAGAAANIGRKKYGKKKFQSAAAKGKKLKGAKTKKEDMKKKPSLKANFKAKAKANSKKVRGSSAKKTGNKPPKGGVYAKAIKRNKSANKK